MQIAVITEDGSTVSQHFGRATEYVVFTVEDGKVTKREKREKAGHNNFAEQHTEEDTGQKHGYDAGSQAKHESMAQAIADCDMLIVGGMGWGAYESMKEHNIEPIITDVENIEETVALYLKDKLPNLMERLH